MNFNVLTKAKAIKVAKEIKPHWTKNKLTHAINQVRSKGGDTYPMAAFFRDDVIGIQEDGKPSEEASKSAFWTVLMANITDEAIKRKKKSTFICRLAMRDVLNGYVLLSRENTRKRMEGKSE